MRLPVNARIRPANESPVALGGEYVLYWMTAYRRVSWNHALDRAVAWARKLQKPLVILEALRCDYPWASDRFHRFVLDGMRDNERECRRKPVTYYPYVEPSPGAGRGLLAALAARACVVVTDDFPAFFLPHMVEAAATRIPVLLEAVDSNGILPLAAHPKVFVSAHQFRRFVHGLLLEEPFDLPKRRPFAGQRLRPPEPLSASVAERWPPAQLDGSALHSSGLERIPIDHGVTSVPVRGGHRAAAAALQDFLDGRLADYAAMRNFPLADATSRLSPYLHFGQLSSHEITHALLERQGWTPDRIEPAAKGRREGWWGLDANGESFLDELVTWRELGFNAARHQPGFDTYESLPVWAIATLHAHEIDLRDYVYTPEQFEMAETHDPVWNAAQRQLLREGRIHGYLRMLWGKKILEWSPTPELAFEIMVELNNKYALDGRDPNSYSGILWVLGKYDRPWGPERSVFGQVRYMSSQNTARKFPMHEYLRRYGP